jgi:dipeptidyl-peptidase-3
VSLLAASGQALGPGFTGLTLPADPRLLQRLGSRSWVVVSADEPEERLRGERLVREFVLPEVAQEAARCRPQVAFALAAYREVLGHPSGKLSPGLKGDPRALLAPYYWMLEEARVQAVALYQIGDPITVVSGILSDGGCQSVAVPLAAMEALTSLATVPRGDLAEDDRLRATLLIQGWLLEKEAVEISVRGSSRYARVLDRDAWRSGLASLLAELQRVKAAGDRKAIEELVERHATHIDPGLRDEVLARMRRAGIPARLATLPPVLEAVRDAAGRAIDARARAARSVDDLIAVYEQVRRGE